MLGEDIVWSCLWRARCVQAKPRVFGGDIRITWLGFSPRNYHYALVNSRLRFEKKLQLVYLLNMTIAIVFLELE